ncbi:MAG: FadR/GntR family transcriptional regulator [Pseudomonadota bacterium]
MEMQKSGGADIAAAIRRDIASGVLRQHDRLPPERVLSTIYGAARGTVRKALAQLEHEGFVEIRAGSGSYVVHEPTAPSMDAIALATPLEMMDARFALEPHICRLAVLHGRRDDFERMDALCKRMEDCADAPEAFSDSDADFHRALVDSTRNGLLIWMIGQISAVRVQDDWNRMRKLTLDRPTIETYNLQHRQILNAIRAREPERAARLMKEHLETARLSLTRVSAT